jgi:hypothetical protein
MKPAKSAKKALIRHARGDVNIERRLAGCGKSKLGLGVQNISL